MASRREGAEPKRPPATTVQSRENQVIAAAYDLAEKQILDGKASSQVITHFLKLGSTREALEKERLQQENLLTAAKIDSLQSAKRMEELYNNALNAMRTYAGQDSPGEIIE